MEFVFSFPLLSCYFSKRVKALHPTPFFVVTVREREGGEWGGRVFLFLCYITPNKFYQNVDMIDTFDHRICSVSVQKGPFNNETPYPSPALFFFPNYSMDEFSSRLHWKYTYMSK